jgi:hypothetical protein
MSIVSEDVVMGDSSESSSLLPNPRRQPLTPGSKKEEIFRTYVDEHLLDFQRKYAKRFLEPDTVSTSTNVTSTQIAPGYNSIKQVTTDLTKLIEIVWLSGSRKRH